MNGRFGSDHDGPDEGLELSDVQTMFAEFATNLPELPLYAAICRGVAADPEAAAPLLAASAGQRRPVLWLAALHDLVLRDPAVAAARWYAGAAARDPAPPGDPWPDVRCTVLEHRDTLTETIATHSTQTNEVNRAVYLAAAFGAACADVAEQTVALVEMGASAGLLLLLDHYRIERRSSHGNSLVGAPHSPVVCVGEDRSDTVSPAAPLPIVASRVGLDLHPVAIDDVVGLRWLEACLWPDVPGRLERFRSAVELAREHPPTLVRGDMVDDLAAVVALAQQNARPSSQVVVFSSWALTYVARERRQRVAEVLDRAAARGVPVSWVTAEPMGCMPGVTLPPSLTAHDATTVLAVRRWRDGSETEPRVLGTCHPHGEWIDLTVG
ncbi:MAG: DUF2332 domain-containing protein [Humibacillus sp.]|nr:DUF2332 domain-containing protein [Humibacillus sp.]MDN5779392.1 DUF2332 domain-containing protein [Humibacillus sp.]